MSQYHRTRDMEAFRALGEHYKEILQEIHRSSALLRIAEQGRVGARDEAERREPAHDTRTRELIAAAVRRRWFTPARDK